MSKKQTKKKPNKDWDNALLIWAENQRTQRKLYTLSQFISASIPLKMPKTYKFKEETLETFHNDLQVHAYNLAVNNARLVNIVKTFLDREYPIEEKKVEDIDINIPSIKIIKGGTKK